MTFVMIPGLLLAVPAIWLIFLTLYASLKFFKWLRKWNP